MSSIAIQIQEKGLDQALRAAEKLTGFDRVELMDTVGRLIQLQTRRRLEVDKTAPDGTAWKKTYRGDNILYNTGALTDSIDYQSDRDSVLIGSPLIYAAIHHFGGKITAKNGKGLAFSSGGNDYVVQSVTIPARPYIGLSAANTVELESALADFMSEVMQ